jgi:hypothetical protein
MAAVAKVASSANVVVTRAKRLITRFPIVRGGKKTVYDVA